MGINQNVVRVANNYSHKLASSLETPLPPKEKMPPLKAEKLGLSRLTLKLWERLLRSMRY